MTITLPTKKIHLWTNGKRPLVPAETKAKILKRISSSATLTDEQKAQETKVVKAYWSQYDL